MPALPRITSITPSYNQGEYIEQTISSVLDQDYPDLEYIVMDGGSTDQTLELLRKYESRLSWVSEADRGQSHAINKGMERATGEVIGYLNSDDQLMPGALLKGGKYFQDHPQAFWLTGKCRTVNDANQDIRKPITLYKNFWLITRSSAPLSVLNYIYQPATFWRKDPDARWRLAPDAPAQLAPTQSALLSSVRGVLGRSGTLVYSTCTQTPEENDEVIATFLACEPGLRRTRPESLAAALRPLLDAEGPLRTWPHRHGMDGFFAVRLEART